MNTELANNLLTQLESHPNIPSNSRAGILRSIINYNLKYIEKSNEVSENVFNNAIDRVQQLLNEVKAKDDDLYEELSDVDYAKTSADYSNRASIKIMSPILFGFVTLNKKSPFLSMVGRSITILLFILLVMLTVTIITSKLADKSETFTNKSNDMKSADKYIKSGYFIPNNWRHQQNSQQYFNAPLTSSGSFDQEMTQVYFP